MALVQLGSEDPAFSRHTHRAFLEDTALFDYEKLGRAARILRGDTPKSGFAAGGKLDIPNKLSIMPAPRPTPSHVRSETRHDALGMAMLHRADEASSPDSPQPPSPTRIAESFAAFKWRRNSEARRLSAATESNQDCPSPDMLSPPPSYGSSPTADDDEDRSFLVPGIKGGDSSAVLLVDHDGTKYLPIYETFTSSGQCQVIPWLTPVDDAHEPLAQYSHQDLRATAAKHAHSRQCLSCARSFDSTDVPAADKRLRALRTRASYDSSILDSEELVRAQRALHPCQKSPSATRERERLAARHERKKLEREERERKTAERLAREKQRQAERQARRDSKGSRAGSRRGSQERKSSAELSSDEALKENSRRLSKKLWGLLGLEKVIRGPLDVVANAADRPRRAVTAPASRATSPPGYDVTRRMT